MDADNCGAGAAPLARLCDADDPRAHRASERAPCSGLKNSPTPSTADRRERWSKGWRDRTIPTASGEVGTAWLSWVKTVCNA